MAKVSYSQLLKLEGAIIRVYEEKGNYFDTCSIFIFQNALQEAGIEDQAIYLVIEIETREDCSEIQDYLQQLTGGRSVSKMNLIYSGPGRSNYRNEAKSFLR